MAACLLVLISIFYELIFTYTKDVFSMLQVIYDLEKFKLDVEEYIDEAQHYLR